MPPAARVRTRRVPRRSGRPAARSAEPGSELGASGGGCLVASRRPPAPLPGHDGVGVAGGQRTGDQHAVDRLVPRVGARGIRPLEPGRRRLRARRGQAMQGEPVVGGAGRLDEALLRQPLERRVGLADVDRTAPAGAGGEPAVELEPVGGPRREQGEQCVAHGHGASGRGEGTLHRAYCSPPPTVPGAGPTRAGTLSCAGFRGIIAHDGSPSTIEHTRHPAVPRS